MFGPIGAASTDYPRDVGQGSSLNAYSVRPEDLVADTLVHGMPSRLGISAASCRRGGQILACSIPAVVPFFRPRSKPRPPLYGVKATAGELGSSFASTQVDEGDLHTRTTHTRCGVCAPRSRRVHLGKHVRPSRSLRHRPQGVVQTYASKLVLPPSPWRQETTSLAARPGSRCRNRCEQL